MANGVTSVAMTKSVASQLFLALALWALPTDGAEAQVDAPSRMQRELEAPDPTAGPEDEIDAAEAQAEAAEAGDPTGLSRATTAKVEEIVVQARKRSELLEDTPIAVTAIGDQILRASNVQRIDQIAPLAPNLQFGTGLSGENSNIVIRGIGRGAASPAFDPGVALYVDGVFLARSQAAVLDVLDIQQIEVLRGPQGTLFGKNTVGGAINITTVKPKADPEAFAMVRPGNLGSVDTRSMVNVPIGDGEKMAVRAAFASRLRDGYVQNPNRPNAPASDVNSLSFLGSLRYDPIDTVSIVVSGSWATSQTRTRGAQCILANPNAALIGLLPGYEEACNQTSPFEWTSEAHNLSNFSNWGAWGTVQWDLGEDISALEGLYVRNLTSWRRQASRLRQDLDATFLPVVTLQSAGGSDPINGTPGSYQQISEEFQLGGTFWEDRIDFVSGFFGYWEEARQGNVTVVPALGQNTENLITTDNFNWALFGQATGRVTDWMSLTAGVRYSRDRKSLIYQPHPAGEPIDPAAGGSGEETFPSWTPTASVALTLPEDMMGSTPLDHLMGYFTYSRGFKGGGFNGIIGAGDGPLTSFEPETLDNFEIGFKTISFEERLTMNLTLFYGIYDDIQVVTIIVEETPDGPVASRPTLNAAKATTKGVEFDFRAIPIPGMIVAGNIGVIRAVYDEFDGVSDLTGDAIDRSGQVFANVPPVASFLSAQYSFPIDGELPNHLKGWLTPRLEWRFQAAFRTLGPEVPEARQPHINLLNARLSYDFLDDRAQIALWGRNLTDIAYFNTTQSIASFFGNINNYYAPPRTWGGEISYRF